MITTTEAERCEVCSSNTLSVRSRARRDDGITVYRYHCASCGFSPSIFMRGIRVLTDEELMTLEIIPRYTAVLSGADTNAIRRQWERILNQKTSLPLRQELITLSQLFARCGIVQEDLTDS